MFWYWFLHPLAAIPVPFVKIQFNIGCKEKRAVLLTVLHHISGKVQTKCDKCDGDQA